MNETKLGQLVDSETKSRDAVHVAIMPVTAACDLRPGEHVGFVGQSRDTVGPPAADGQIAPVGIVDPFLTNPVKSGKRFWLCVYPGTITSLRHVWTHPAIRTTVEPQNQFAESEAWLRCYARRLKPYTVEDNGADAAYERMMREINEGEVFAHGTDLSGPDDLDDADEFFQHLAIVLGRPVDRHNLSYHCSC